MLWNLFLRLIINEVNVYFMLQYVETSNLKIKKELQMRMQYWSNIQNLVINQHFITYFIEKADAITLLNHLLKH